jgi:hypothetical protein
MTTVAVLLLVVAGAVWRLSRTLGIAPRERWVALALALPGAVLNAGLLVRTDALWAAACLMALDAALRRRDGAMAVWYGLALGVSVNAAVFAPFVLAVLIHRRVAPLRWLLAAAGYAAVAMPGALLGWPSENPLDAPNIWFVANQMLPGMAPGIAGVAVVGTVGVGACFIARFSAQMPSAAVRLLPVALLASLSTAGLWPHMPAGGFLLAGLIAPVWAVLTRERRAWQAALLVQAVLILPVGDGGVLAATASCAALAVAAWLTMRPSTRRAANDNALPMRWHRAPTARTMPA